MSAFDDWLAKLRAAGKGPGYLYATRGRHFICPIAIQGDWTEATLRGQVRLSPDAAGDPLAEFSVLPPDLVDGFTTFTISLSEAATSTPFLPAAPAGEGNVELVFDLLISHDFGFGDIEELLFGGIFNLTGRVTEVEIS